MSIDHERLAEPLRKRLAARPEILEAYLFGSRVRGDAALHSDVDVAVYLSAERPPDSAYGYAAELTAELSTLLRRNDVDVVLLNRAPPLLYHRVLRDGVRLFARDLKATTTREGRALSRYCDYLPQLRKIEAGHTRRIRQGNFGR